MINKIVNSAKEAVADIFDGATIMISGFGEAGSPIELIHALVDQGAKNLTIVSNNAGSGNVGLAALIENKQVRKIICSFPRTAISVVFPEMYRKGEIELELVPQGTLAERIRSAGAGIPAFFTQTSVNTPLAEGKDKRVFNDKTYVLEHAIEADFSFVKCSASDKYGNLIYNKTARNFGPIMCMAAKTTIVQAKNILDVGEIDPECVITPGIFVKRVVEITNPADESKLVEEKRRYPWN